jgi:putative tryptophan/tyrosine transport system substrate-binding protein
MMAAMALVRPIAAASQARMPRIGLVSIGADAGNPGLFRPFLDQMRELGYVEGRNVAFERRFAAGRDELITEFTADLVRRNVDVIVVTGQRESIAAGRATSVIPVVTIVNPDPIALGHAQSLARPGGNITGLATLDLKIYGKRVALLKEAVPSLKKVAILVSKGNPTYGRGSDWAHEVEAAGHSVGVETILAEMESETFDEVISEFRRRGVQGIVGASDGVIVARRAEVAASALRHHLPSIFAWRLNAEAGGLMSYAAKVEDLSRRAAFFVDRILKGAKPSDLPFEQPTTFELVINMKTARVLDLDLPATLLARADEVIE